MRFFLALSLIALLLLTGCTQDAPAPADPPVQPAALNAQTPRPAGPSFDEFGDYWYQGEAELTSYDLEQARYGEIHDGHAVLIFVTEPFSQRKQVKLDDPSTAGDDAVNVLKLNHTRKFNTGLYPYSMMTSVFTPVHRQAVPHTLKVTTSVQEWCGHVFVQLNRTDAGYRAQQYSYFESEGDTTLALPDVMLEDEVWTTLRLNPEDLPTGEIQMVPGTQFTRLGHTAWGPQAATATLETTDDSLRTYTITYPDLNRSLAIRFQADFPYEIEGWTETRRSGFGPGPRELTTTATRRARTMSPYWQQNSVADEGLRQELLGLEN